MKPVAKNPNESLPNRHALFCAISGAGKTQAMAQNEHLQKKSNRAIFWDTHASFRADGYSDMVALVAAVKAAEKKGGGYRIAYTGKKSQKAFAQLCRITWSVLDGKKPHVLVVDELASVAEAIGKDRSEFGDLLRESRKFNLVILCSATRAAEIPKTVFTNCQTKAIGAQGSTSDAKTMADFLQIDYRLLFDTELQPLNFWIKQPGKAAVKSVIKYKEPPL